jgi:hypothetical protein
MINQMIKINKLNTITHKKIKLLLLIPFLTLPLSVYCDENIGPFISSGYVEGYLYPSHNEYDPNPGIPFEERIVARYGLDVYSTLALQRMPRLYLFGDLISFFGDTHPQTDYNYSAKPIVGISTVGFGYALAHHVDVGVASSMHHNYGGYQLQHENLMWSAVTLKVHW